MAAGMGITAYWPVTCLFIILYSDGVGGVAYASVASYAALLVPISVFGLWGLWRIRHPVGG
jgi:hypothetical protein